MKTVFFIMVTAMLISSCGNCQWFERRYGVDDIYQLSDEQLNDAFKRARTGTWVGAILTTVGAAGLITGIAIASSANDMGRAGEARAYEGVFLAMGSVPLGIAGVTIWGINGTRLQTIKEIMNKTEIKPGVLNYPSGNYSRDFNCSFIPGFSITFNF